MIEAARTGTAACGVTGLLVTCLFSPFTRADDVPRAGEPLGVVQPAHTDSHREELHDRTDYGKRYKFLLGTPNHPAPLNNR